jgi:DNA polymerase-2
MIRRGIRGGVRISGEWRAGKNVAVVFHDPVIEPVHSARAPLSVLSIDLETGEPGGIIRAAGISQCSGGGSDRRKSLLFNGAWKSESKADPEIEIYPGERQMLEALVQKIREFDPDIITGWNIIDFDFPRLAEAFGRNKLDFTLARSMEAGRFFPAEKDADDEGGTVRRSASVFLPGRQVLDALRLIRTGFESFDSYTLDAVAHSVLGRGKTVQSTDADKLAELDRLYADDPLLFCRYCLNDADLVLDILDKRGLIAHTIERAALTGAGIDKAWTSVASFERVYAEGLYARGVLEPEADMNRSVSGAAGGTVLDAFAGMFKNVAVFDFRSLYPSIMRTFNVDPLSYERALSIADARTAPPGSAGPLFIKAPNGAAFTRGMGILPELIAEYFSERIRAIDRGDDASAFVYKILMNSFYGVLGTPKCKYARTELAGAITSFGKTCLHFARDFFVERGYRVLYGDTDSVFVELKDTTDAPFCEGMAASLNAELGEYIRTTYGCESFIGIRFEKLYRRFFIPRLRSDEDNGEHGRAKGYAGLLEGKDGETVVDIKGMEAVRSDYTPLAQRFQRELLGILFGAEDVRGAEEYVRDQTEKLYQGKFDDELIFRKKLRREPESYTASTPPHIKVARSLGWTHRRGTVEYYITVHGPEALSLRRSPIDYAWYASSQLLPIARSAGLAAGFDADSIIGSVHASGQLEFKFSSSP